MEQVFQLGIPGALGCPEGHDCQPTYPHPSLPQEKLSIISSIYHLLREVFAAKGRSGRRKEEEEEGREVVGLETTALRCPGVWLWRPRLR